MEVGTGLLVPLALGWQARGAEPPCASETWLRGLPCQPGAACAGHGKPGGGGLRSCGRTRSALNPGEQQKGRRQPARPRPLALPCPAGRRILFFFPVWKQTN